MLPLLNSHALNSNLDLKPRDLRGFKIIIKKLVIIVRSTYHVLKLSIILYKFSILFNISFRNCYRQQLKENTKQQRLCISFLPQPQILPAPFLTVAPSNNNLSSQLQERAFHVACLFETATVRLSVRMFLLSSMPRSYHHKMILKERKTSRFRYTHRISSINILKTHINSLYIYICIKIDLIY